MKERLKQLTGSDGLGGDKCDSLLIGGPEEGRALSIKAELAEGSTKEKGCKMCWMKLLKCH